MIENVRIRVEGIPEEIQRIADALELLFPGALSWHDEGKTSEVNFVSVSGVGMPWFARAKDQHDGAWARESRGRMADIARKTKRYPSDLTDGDRERIAPEVDFREILNAIRYMARSAGGWRILPSEFGPWQTVYWWFRRFVRRLLFRTIHDVALMLDSERDERQAPLAA